MKRRNFIIGAGAASIGGSALIGTQAFSTIESHRSITVEIAEDPNAYLGMKPLDTPNGRNYVGLDDQGHLEIDIGEHDDFEGDPDGASPGEGVNSESFTWLDGLFELCNQGKEGACISYALPEGVVENDVEEQTVTFYYVERDDERAVTNRRMVGEGEEILLELGECAEIGVRTVTKGVDAADTPLVDGEVALTADVDGDCFEDVVAPECVECDAGEGSEEFLTIENLDTSAFPEIEATVRVDTDAGGDGDLDESNFTVCEDRGGEEFGQTETVTFAGEDEGAEADVMLVLDTSGSMSGQKLTDAQNGAKELVDTLGPGVNVGLVEFDSSATTPQGLTSDKQAVRDAIDALTAGGGTNIGTGIDAAQDEFDANGRAGVPKFMVVLGNGDTSGGEQPATDAKNAGTAIYGIAYGSGASVDDFEDIVGEEPNDPDWPDFAFDADQDDITQIFEDIGQIISGTYAVEYVTCNPEEDGSTRDVLIYVDDPAEGDADETESYTAPTS